MANKDETPIIPQAAALLLISYLVYRYFFGASATAAVSTASPQNARRTADPRRLQQQVETVRGMFPQFSYAAVEAELLRNGGNIEVATERILSTGFLPEPPRPVAATPPPPAPTTPRPARARPAGSGSSTPRLEQYTDLITRYSLHGRLAEEKSVTATGPPGTGKAPGNKADRHMAHKVKRDEMILAARCRVENMIAKEREEGGR